MLNYIGRRGDGSLKVNKITLIKAIRTAASERNLRTLEGARPLAEEIAREVQDEIDGRERQNALEQIEHLRNLRLYEGARA